MLELSKPAGRLPGPTDRRKENNRDKRLSEEEEEELAVETSNGEDSFSELRRILHVLESRNLSRKLFVLEKLLDSAALTPFSSCVLKQKKIMNRLLFQINIMFINLELKLDKKSRDNGSGHPNGLDCSDILLITQHWCLTY